MHQDNAYYGLDNGRALTFYIPINAQNASLGGLSYLAIEQSSEVYEHVPSKSSGFSLEVKNKEDVLKNIKKSYLTLSQGIVQFITQIVFIMQRKFHVKLKDVGLLDSLFILAKHLSKMDIMNGTKR